MKLRQNDLVLREIDGEMVLLDLESSTYLSTNTTGTFLLQLLAEEREREALIAALAAEFGISEQDAVADTDAFLSELHRQNLLA